LSVETNSMNSLKKFLGGKEKRKEILVGENLTKKKSIFIFQKLGQNKQGEMQGGKEKYKENNLGQILTRE